MRGLTGPRHHAIDLVELTVTDLPAAKRFYAGAFGWGFAEGTYAFPGGRRLHFADPSGNQLGVRVER
jgi:predicted enzyme related to lactoylglutathione lyase